MYSFKLAEREISSQAWEIQVEGDLDLAVAPQLQEAISRCDTPLLVIDLERCEFLDSTGIAVILRAHRLRAEDGGCLAVHSPRAQVLRILTVTGLAENGLVYPDREGVLASVGAGGTALRAG